MQNWEKKHMLMWTLGKPVCKILGKGPDGTLLFDVSYPRDLVSKSSQNLKQHQRLFTQSFRAANFCVLPFPPPQLLQHYPSQSERTGPEGEFFLKSLTKS